MATIRELIQRALKEGRTVRQLEHDSAYRVKFQTFQELSTQKPLQFPKSVKTIAGMAQALRITETAVVLAYAESLGVSLEARSEFAMRLPSDVDQIDMDMQNALIAVARAAVKSRSRIGTGGRNQPQDDPLVGDSPDWEAPSKKSRVLGSEDGKHRNKGGG